MHVDALLMMKKMIDRNIQDVIGRRYLSVAYL